MGMLWLGAAALQGQSAIGTVTKGPADSQEMPKDPGALMRLAAGLNGLGGDELEPWHFKASYTLADAQGKTESEGEIEESWAGPHQARTTYTAGSQSLSAYLTENGTFQSGDLAMAPWLVKAARNEIVQPLPGLKAVSEKRWIGKQHQVGSMKMTCIETKEPASDHPAAEFQTPTYCFGEDKPIPRLDISMGGYRQAARNGLVRFQGRFIPRDVRIADHGVRSITVHVDVLEALKSVNAADFAPPADAKLMQGRLDVPSGTATGRLVKPVQPVYPPAAKARGVQGMVVLEGVIGTDGHLSQLEVVGGPPELQMAAKDAVQQWVYSPYELNGVPVQVETSINVVFNLAR